MYKLLIYRHNSFVVPCVLSFKTFHFLFVVLLLSLEAVPSQAAVTLPALPIS